MKKARIMLIAIAVIATVGGALAFKAQRFQDMNVYCATKINNVITCSTTSFKTTPDVLSTTLPCKTWHEAVFGIAAPTTTSYYTTIPNCPPPVHSTVYSTVDL